MDADAVLLLGRPGVRRLDRAVGLPELRPGGDAGEPARGSSTLPDDVPVLPGHGPDTTVGRERASNPFLRELV